MTNVSNIQRPPELAETPTTPTTAIDLLISTAHVAPSIGWAPLAAYGPDLLRLLRAGFNLAPKETLSLDQYDLLVDAWSILHDHLGDLVSWQYAVRDWTAEQIAGRIRRVAVEQLRADDDEAFDAESALAVTR